MATTEQVTLNADDLAAAGRATQNLEPKTPVEISRTDQLVTLTWPSNGTTGTVIQDGGIVDAGDS